MSLAPPHIPLPLQPPEVNWVCFLPKQFTRVIQPADQEWITHILYDSTGQLKQNLSQNWFHPPSPTKSISPPDPHNSFRQRMFLWDPMRMWGIPLKCTQCSRKMHHSDIYTKVRESEAVYQLPPPFSPLPLAQFFETVHANDILSHLDELKGVITSTFGRILKLDSTKKITKKLAGGIEGTTTSNIGNEFGQVLNSVLTTGEGLALMIFVKEWSKGKEMLVSQSQMPYMWTETTAVRQQSGLLPEFIPPGKPTGERIDVEYLLTQSNRGDLLSAQKGIGAIPPEMLDEAQEDECPPGHRFIFPDFISPASSPFEDSGPITSTPDSQCDPRGIPGWEAVNALAGKKKTLSVPWRASRKHSGSAPGQQAAERLFMVHGQAAHRPDINRISECALRFYKEFREARNRPKDNKGKTFAIPQSIVMTYGHIKQLIEDCKDIHKHQPFTSDHKQHHSVLLAAASA
ncbi:hypothetical protein PFLUV_G00079350 [Perca fluviatilis]|uniref:DUF6729 domain-containing protein n=1 Tax=Perca fluviatilis TaxID=8168 RepID=A0A6A5EDY3_PERFL|nr:hypothetical protein PFLUV_G00079350 [Perca fluviatilis]